MLEEFGAKISSQKIEEYGDLPYFYHNKFHNDEPIVSRKSKTEIAKLIFKQFFIQNNRRPKASLPVADFDLRHWQSDDTTKIVWYGHASILLQMSHKTLLIDPVFNSNIAPVIALRLTRSFTKKLDYIVSQLPDIDAVFISHDHYDHLDYKSIVWLKSKVKHFYVALGVARHLMKWGVEASKITECQWWQNESLDDINIYFTPTRHFSGRTMSESSTSMWGGWCFACKDERIYFSGDSGYGQHFKSIGDKLGPFDFAMMESGQYSHYWPNVHMTPEQSIDAGIDVGANILMPVHWGRFILAQHPWQEPVQRFIDYAHQQNKEFIVPKLGEIFNYRNYQTQKWWQNL